MSSLPRREIAFPRGRPSIVPISSAHLPSPTWERSVFYAIDGRPFQWLTERWLTSDTWACVTASFPDPERPGHSTSTRMIDWASNAVIPAVAEHDLMTVVRVLKFYDHQRVALRVQPTLEARHPTAKPTTRWRTGYEIAGAIYTLVGERWRAEDRHASPSACLPDTQRPGVWLTTRLLGPKGEFITPVSFEAFASLLPSPAVPLLRLARPCGP